MKFFQVLFLKKKIGKATSCSDPENLRVGYDKRIMKNDRSLSHYSIPSGGIIKFKTAEPADSSEMDEGGQGEGEEENLMQTEEA